MEEVGRIVLNISREDLSGLKYDLVDGVEVKFEFDVQITFGSMLGTIVFETKVGNDTLGQTNIIFPKS